MWPNLKLLEIWYLLSFVLLLKSDKFNKPTSEAGLLNKSTCLAPALGVIKFKIVRNMILVTLCFALLLNSDLDRCSTNPLQRLEVGLLNKSSCLAPT